MICFFCENLGEEEVIGLTGKVCQRCFCKEGIKKSEMISFGDYDVLKKPKCESFKKIKRTTKKKK
jgi:hypothetical protein